MNTSKKLSNLRFSVSCALATAILTAQCRALFGNFKVTFVPRSRGLWVPCRSPNGKCITAIKIERNRLKVFRVDRQQWSNLSSKR